jgi:raffinose/stachyose/melibiose transport system permease protein
MPLFILVRDLGLLDRLIGVVLPQSAFGLALSIVLLRGFFKQLPADLWNAALIDGCSHGRFLWHVVLPLSRPILATVAVIVMMTSWNSYLLPLTLLNSSQSYPWTIAITEFASEYSTAWELTLAFIALTLIPAVLFFLLAQRQLIAGLTGGALKG